MGVGGEGYSRGRGYIYVLMADLHCCTAETNTALQNNYPPIKKFKKEFQRKKDERFSVVSSLCNPTDYTSQGILQARILKWVAIPFSRGSSQPRDQTQVSSTAAEGFITHWATGEAQENSGLSLLQQIFPTQELNWVSCIGGRFFTNWAIREAQRKMKLAQEISLGTSTISTGFPILPTKMMTEDVLEGSVMCWSNQDTGRIVVTQSRRRIQDGTSFNSHLNQLHPLQERLENVL